MIYNVEKPPNASFVWMIFATNGQFTRIMLHALVKSTSETCGGGVGGREQDQLSDVDLLIMAFQDKSGLKCSLARR